LTSPAHAPSPPLWHPRHWPTWFGLGLLRAAIVLPYPVLLALGGALGRLMWWTMARRRRIALTNLQLCFPHWPASRHRRVCRDTFRSLGIAVFETGLAWWSPPQRLRRLTRVEGMEFVQHALDNGRPVIWLGAHYTTLDLSGSSVQACTPFRHHAVYRPHENPVIEHVMVRGRSASREYMIARDDIRKMVKALRRGGIVWFAADQNFGHKNSVFSPFFGVPAATNTATARLARLTGATVIPFVSRRLPGTEGYLLRFLPPLTDFPSDDIQRDTDRVNAVIEAQVRECPEQYLWVHRRFKDRPPGEKRFY